MDIPLYQLLHPSYAGLAGLVVFALVALVAVLRGDLPGKQLGMALLAMTGVLFFYQTRVPLVSLPHAACAADILLLTLIVGLGVMTPRRWLWTAAGAQALASGLQLALVLGAPVDRTFATSVALGDGYALVAALAYGVARSLRRPWSAPNSA